MQLERILDVNLNRLSESLKFIEDITRFSIADKDILSSVRKIRREFQEVKKALPLSSIIGFRKSQTDLGRGASFDEHAKKGKTALVIANLSRAKESARILEEIFKLRNLRLSRWLKDLRFKIYDLETAIIGALKKIFSPKLCAILDERYLNKSSYKKIIRILETAGATMIQLRVKTLSERDFYNWAARIKKIKSRPEVKFIINDHVAIAQAVDADGVHLGQDDLPVRAARRILGDGFIIGASAHNLAGAKQAERDGADYIGVGAVFKSATKPEAEVCGLKRLESIIHHVDIPVIGIGGINNKNFRRVLQAGAAGIAVSSYLFTGDLKKNLRLLNLFVHK